MCSVHIQKARMNSFRRYSRVSLKRVSNAPFSEYVQNTLCSQSIWINPIICLFRKRTLQKRRYSVKETYNFKEPTNLNKPRTQSQISHAPAWISSDNTYECLSKGLHLTCEWVTSAVYISRVSQKDYISHVSESRLPYKLVTCEWVTSAV